MNSRVHIATFSQNALTVCRNLGTGIELNDTCISENLDAENFDRTVAAMKDEIEKSGAESIILHGPFTEICPASIDHRVVELGMERLNEAYEVCSILGINRMVVHTGYIPLIYFPEWQEEKALIFWKQFMRDKPENFELYIENVFEEEPYSLNSLIDKLADARIKVCLDVGHANAVMNHEEMTILKWIEVLGKNIGHFHLHNNDGKNDNHNPLQEGTMDMKKIIAAIKENCSENVTMTIESRECAESAEWLISELQTKNI